MNKKLRAFLEANGLRADATEAEAWAKYDELLASGMEFPGIDPGTRSAVTGPTTTSATTAANQPVAGQVDVDAAVRTALQAEATRRGEIEDRLQIAGLRDHNNGEFARGMLLDPAFTVERAAQLIFAEMKIRSTAIGDGARSGWTVGRDSREKMRSAITDGLLIRCGHRLEKPADGAREFRGRHMVEICRELMESAGINTRGLGKLELVARALASGNTTDFPLIMGALINKNLLKAYMEWPATWTPFVGFRPANDFKLMHSLKLSGAPDLQGMNENGEYRTATFSEAGESYRVNTKGIKVAFTREMIINDDTGALTRIPQLFGTSARRMEADAVYSLITANGNMSDGVPLFHATHKNLAAVNAAVASASLGLARVAMRKQTGLAGEVIDVTPAFLLAPVVKETDVDMLLMSAALPVANMSSGVKNPWAGKLTPITDPRLDADSLTSWYLLAHPNQVPFIEVSYLEGEEQPYVEETIDFNSDALITKVRHDFGAGVVDHIGAYKNIGV